MIYEFSFYHFIIHQLGFILRPSLLILSQYEYVVRENKWVNINQRPTAKDAGIME